MRVSRAIPPYKSNNKTNLQFCVKKSGVYIIYKNGVARYIGYSETNLYATILHHFTQWRDKRQVRVTYVDQLKHNDFTVRVVLCTPARARKLEKALIVKYKPKDNPDKLRGYELSKGELQAQEQFETTRVSDIKGLYEYDPF